MRIINSIFKTFVLSLLLISQVHFAYSQSAALLPNASQVFLDNNGKPLSSGTVNFYIPGTLTPKMVWQDANQTVPWTQPITLNAAGRPPGDKGIYGNGVYRQIVKAQNTNQIWDQPTAAVGTGGGAGTNVGDGNSVGTIITWAGMIAPNQYQFAYGQSLSRVTYPELFQATTLLTNVTCVGGDPILTGIADTSNIPIGSPVEGNCITVGSVVNSKTINSVTLSIAASISTNSTVRFFPYGNGNGSDTFNVVDLRGKVIPGRTNMGGVTSSNLTSTYCGSNPDAVGANCGNQSKILLRTHLPNITFSSGGLSAITTLGNNTNLLRVNTLNATLNGSGSLDVLRTAGLDGLYTVTASTSISGTIPTGGSDTPISVIQPSLTLNYVIKVTPDVSVSGLFGVASIGGMQGIIACGTGLTCVGNIISAISSNNAGGLNTQVQYNNSGTLAGNSCFIWVSPSLTVGGTGCTGQLKLGGTTSGFLTQTVGSIAGTPVITWGNTSGTPAVTASAPLVLNTTTGNMTITGSALTKTDDTNVTITLGGTPTTALLAPTSLTVGWTGTLAAARLNANVVQAIVNDTNITGSISAQSLTLGWTGNLALTRGGTGQSTALAARSSTGLNIDSATSTGDANYTILPTDRLVYHTALSTARTDTLPAANSVNIGQVFYINDFRGVASASNTITLQRAGSDTINGVNSVVAIATQYGAGLFWSDGVSRWTYLPAGSGGGGSGTVTNATIAADTGISVSGTCMITTTGTCTIANSAAFGQVRLSLSGGNIVLSRFNGSFLLIDTTVQVVPSGGVSLAPTGLTPSTLYYIYAYMSSGTMTLEASTTASAINVSTGFRIKSGDATRTLVGIVRPVTGPAFTDTLTQRFVRSWFNSEKARLIGPGVASSRTVASGTLAEVNSETRTEFLAWLNETITVQSSGSVFNSGSFYTVYSVGLNGAATFVPTSGVYGTAGGPMVVAGALSITSEGYNYITLIGAATGGSTGTFYSGTGDLGPCRVTGTLMGP